MIDKQEFKKILRMFAKQGFDEIALVRLVDGRVCPAVAGRYYVVFDHNGLIKNVPIAKQLTSSMHIEYFIRVHIDKKRY